MASHHACKCASRVSWHRCMRIPAASRARVARLGSSTARLLSTNATFRRLSRLTTRPHRPDTTAVRFLRPPVGWRCASTSPPAACAASGPSADPQSAVAALRAANASFVTVATAASRNPPSSGFNAPLAALFAVLHAVAALPSVVVPTQHMRDEDGTPRTRLVTMTGTADDGQTPYQYVLAFSSMHAYDATFSDTYLSWMSDDERAAVKGAAVPGSELVAQVAGVSAHGGHAPVLVLDPHDDEGRVAISPDHVGSLLPSASEACLVNALVYMLQGVPANPVYAPGTFATEYFQRAISRVREYDGCVVLASPKLADVDPLDAAMVFPLQDPQRQSDGDEQDIMVVFTHVIQAMHWLHVHGQELNAVPRQVSGADLWPRLEAGDRTSRLLLNPTLASRPDGAPLTDPGEPYTAVLERDATAGRVLDLAGFQGDWLRATPQAS